MRRQRGKGRVCWGGGSTSWQPRVEDRCTKLPTKRLRALQPPCFRSKGMQLPTWRCPAFGCLRCNAAVASGMLGWTKHRQVFAARRI